jgi:carbon monoxide dehydrogenase subunit G
MKLEQSFTVTAPVEQVWAMLIDVERVAPCLPGAEITGQTPDGAYEGTFSVRLGPATASYNGSLKMDSLDEAARTATMHARGTDKRGQGGANATIVSTLRQEGDETTVDVATDFTITGRLARFGRGGMIEDISKRLMRDFAQCLQATLAAEQEAGVAPAAAAAPEAAAADEPPAAAADEPAAAAVEEPAAAEPLGTGEAAAAEPASAAEPFGTEDAAAAASEDEPLQPAQAPWPPRRPDAEEAPEPPPTEPLAAAEPLSDEELLPDDDPFAAEPTAPQPEAPATEPLAPPAPAPAAEEPAAPAEPPPAPEPAAPRTGSIPPPTAAVQPPVQPAKPVKGFSLLFGVLWDRIKRFFGRLFGRKREN